MDSSAYASLKQNLNNSAHVAGYIAPVRDEVTNDVAEAGRSAIETAGAFFSQHAIGKIFTAIAKTKGASSEEVEGLAQATARGDGRDIMAKGLDMVMARHQMPLMTLTQVSQPNLKKRLLLLQMMSQVPQPQH